MRDILITKSGVNYGDNGGGADSLLGAWDSDNLLDGSIQFLNKSGAVISSAGAGVVDDEVYAILGRTNEKADSVFMIDRNTFKYNKRVYQAPVAKVLYGGWSQASCKQDMYLPTSLAVGDVAGLWIIDEEKPVEDRSREKYYSYAAVSGDVLTGTAANNIIARLVNAVNSNPFNPPICTLFAMANGANNAGIRFTANTAGHNFTVRFDGIFAHADITEGGTANTNCIVNNVYVPSGSMISVTGNATTLAVGQTRGDGTAAQISDIEVDFATEKGFNVNDANPYLGGWKAAFRTVAGAAYTVYTCTWTPINSRILMNEADPECQLLIAVPSGDAAMIAIMDVVLAAL